MQYNQQAYKTMKAMKQSIEKKISGVGAVAAAVAFIAAVSGHIAVTAIAAVIGIAAVFGWMCAQMAKPAEEGSSL
jgi:hypothetical protein